MRCRSFGDMRIHCQSHIVVYADGSGSYYGNGKKNRKSFRTGIVFAHGISQKKSFRTLNKPTNVKILKSKGRESLLTFDFKFLTSVITGLSV